MAEPSRELLQVSLNSVAIPSFGRVQAFDEIGHRIYNSLQLVASFLTAEGRATSDPASRVAFEDSVQRITAIAAIQRQLYQAPHDGLIDIAAYLRDLASQLCSACGEHRAVHVNAQSLFIDADTATALGIMVTELVINACKHAYAPGEVGQVDVSFASDPGGTFVLEVRDYGRPASVRPAAPASGIGTRIIDGMSRKLGGAALYYRGEEGMRVSVSGSLGARG